jgi:hypothetical protein
MRRDQPIDNEPARASPSTRAAKRRQEREMTQGEAEAFREGFRRGAEAMRRMCENVVMCACPTDEAAHAVNAAITSGPNSAARWRACHRTVCLALLAGEIADLPLPAPEEAT